MGVSRLRRFASIAAIVLPPVALAALGVRASRNEEARVEREVGRLAQGRLDDQAAGLRDVIEGLERELVAATEDLVPGAAPDRVRATVALRPRLRHLVILDARGQATFPPADQPMSASERRFLVESRPLWDRGNIAYPAMAEGDGSGTTGRGAGTPSDDGRGRGWEGLGWGDGGALFWRTWKGGGRAVVGVSGPVLLAALIARLPVTVAGPGQQPVEERIALYDGGGRLVYQWGRFAAATGARPLFASALPRPLEAWRLGYLGPAQPRGRAWGLLAGVTALGVALAVAGLWSYRENGRALREAAQRVSFVNQVSHELKTPLTNVRLYAELLEEHLPEDDPVARQRLDVLLGECRRLGRLITNVLTFARWQRSAPALRRERAVVDDVVRELGSQFTPAFAAKGIALEVRAGAPRAVRVDADALAQILGNLLGNVEKYAPGAPAVVTTAQSPGAVQVTVADGGPGIPPGARERVFGPFVRLEGPSHEAVPGTGIGLGIARDLARLHGGDLRCVDGTAGADPPRGACFVLTLAVEEIA